MNRINKVIITVLTIAVLAFIPTVAFSVNQPETGAVYTMSNAKSGNAVISFDRAADGTLSRARSFSTGGKGTGAALGNQGGIVISADERWLLAVNAGSNEITVFRVERSRLVRTHKINSGGNMPVSIALHGNLVYVLNAGGPGNISGFRMSRQGKLSRISGSTRSLSGNSNPAPAQVSFNPSGSVLLVTEKMTNKIDTYKIRRNGVASNPTVHNSVGKTPFGFAFDPQGHAIVSEAANSSVSSYMVSKNGIGLSAISGAVLNGQKAACWVAVTNTGKFAYVTNAGTDNISSYTVSKSGKLILLKGAAVKTGKGPIDIALTSNNRFLYNLNSKSNSISVSRVRPNGDLVSVTEINGLPGSANGMAAR